MALHGTRALLRWEFHPISAATLPEPKELQPLPCALSCQQKSSGHTPSLGKCFCTVPFCLPIHDHSCIQGWTIKFVSEFSFIVSFLFASISSLSTSGLALITVPWFLFPSWPFPSVFLTPFPSQAPGFSLFLWSTSLLSLVFINDSRLLLCPGILPATLLPSLLQILSFP